MNKLREKIYKLIHEKFFCSVFTQDDEKKLVDNIMIEVIKNRIEFIYIVHYHSNTGVITQLGTSISMPTTQLIGKMYNDYKGLPENPKYRVLMQVENALASIWFGDDKIGIITISKSKIY